MSNQCDIKNGIHPRPCGMINLSNIISYGRGTLPNLIEPEEPEVKEDIDHWLDEEDIGNNFMLRQQYMNQNRQDELDHGFGGKDDDGFRGLDSADGFDGPYTSGFDFDDFDMER